MPVKKFLKKAEDIQQNARKPPEGKKPKKEVDESNWLISYADMMTLLCTLFIMLFSMSKLDAPEYEKVAEEMANHFGGDFKSPSKEMARFVTNVLQEKGVEKEAVVVSDYAGVSIVFSSTMFFDTVTSELSPEGKAVIEDLVDAVMERQAAELKEYKVLVEGHTDSLPLTSGPFASNWELSAARASRIVRLFLEKGFSPEKVIPIGFADTRPAVKARRPSGKLDKEALAQNRRVVVRVLEPGVDTIPWEEEQVPPGGEGAAR